MFYPSVVEFAVDRQVSMAFNKSDRATPATVVQKHESSAPILLWWQAADVYGSQVKQAHTQRRTRAGLNRIRQTQKASLNLGRDNAHPFRPVSALLK